MPIYTMEFHSNRWPYNGIGVVIVVSRRSWSTVSNAVLMSRSSSNITSPLLLTHHRIGDNVWMNGLLRSQNEALAIGCRNRMLNRATAAEALAIGCRMLNTTTAAAA